MSLARAEETAVIKPSHPGIDSSNNSSIVSGE
jgi:hypothetical protein